MNMSKTIRLDEEEQRRIIDCFMFLKDTYAPNENEYITLSNFLSAVERNELTKKDMQTLHDLGNGTELVKMVMKAYYKHDVSKYKEQ